MNTFLLLLLTGLIPLFVGFIWYNEKVFGKAWIQASEMTEEKNKNANMLLIFGVTYIFSVMLSSVVWQLVIHQNAVLSILINEPGVQEKQGEIWNYYQDFMNRFGNNFRTFKHGAFHGAVTGLFFALPLLGINALFERKGFKYIAINTGYWVISLTLIGGCICAWAK